MHHFLIARFIVRTPISGVLYNNAFSLYFTSRALSISTTNNHKVDNFTVSTLINSCGLSPETSLKLSKRLELKNPDAPNLVVEILKNYGFSQTQLSTLIRRCPFVLLSKPDKTVLPKLKFLHSIGVSNTDLPKILIGNTSFITSSLEKTIIPRYEIIKSMVRNDKEVVSTLKHASWYFHCGWVMDDSVMNIEVLRQLGLPQSSISLLVSNFPNVAFMKHSKFVETVEEVKEMGFDPLKSNFVLALQVIAKMNKAMWKSRLKFFEKWGWSKDMCLLAFKRYPQFMMVSEKKIVKILRFLVKEMGVTREYIVEDIVKCPGVLNRNLEKTFIPRCAVINILKSRGLTKNDLSISTFILITEKLFFERYVARFPKDASLLLNAYKGEKLG